MNRFVLFAAILLCLPPLTARAAEREVRELEISRPGDLEMGCGALSREAALMRDIITVTQDIKDDRHMNDRGITAMGAVGSLLVGTATGGIGLAAAGLLATEVNDSGSEQAESVQDIAAQRRAFMIGIYNAKGCEGPIEHTMREKPLNFSQIEPAAGGQGEQRVAGNEPAYNP